MRIRRRDLLKLGAWAASSGLFPGSHAFAQVDGREPGPIGPGVGRRSSSSERGFLAWSLPTSEKRDRFIVDELERAHPGLKQNLENIVVKVWHKDPWVKGALGLPGPGQMTGILVDADKPEGRIHFAGEHLSRLQGWMQGALESGLRAVREVHEAARL
jgi:monoamine oxidase